MLSAPELIRLARLAAEANSPYLDQFRDAALAKADDNPHIYLAAYTLATDRGEEDDDGAKAHEWFAKAVALSGKDGPVQTVSMRNIVERAPGRNERRTDTADRMLRQAEVPIFIAAQAVRRQPTDLILGQALRNIDAEDKRLRYPVFAFSGAQVARDLRAARAVAFDITAIITLDYLGLLDKTFSGFERVLLAPSTLGSLFIERQFLRFHQPSRMAQAQRIQSLIASGRLKIASA